MTQTLYDALQGMNPEVVTVVPLIGSYDYADGGNTNDEDDLFQCGKCKKQFSSLGSFMVHKKTHQLGNQAGSVAAGQKTLTEGLASDTSNEPDLQFQPIILSESDILSFSIGQAGLNLSSADQGLQSFGESETLMIPKTGVSQLTESRDLPSSFELRSTQIILTTQITNEEPMEKLLLADAGTGSDPTYFLDQPINFLDSEPLIVTQSNNIEEEHRKELDLIGKEDELKLSKESKLKCPYCFRQFNKNFDLQQHIRCHTGERPFQCVVCGRSFIQKSHVKKHMATHKVWPQKIRTLSDKPIQRILVKSDETAVVVDKSFVCQYCAASFNSFIQLKSHLKTHADSKIFKCVQKNCQSEFETLESFLEHTATHQSDADVEYRCCHCRQQFTSLDELGNHQRLQGSCVDKKLSFVTCKLCKSKFSTIEALESHQAKDPHSYPCPECSKVYVCERDLRRHLVSHTSLREHPCPECGKKSKTPHSLSLHSLVHSKERPFVCKLCSASFVRQFRLIRHMLIHETTYRYKCPFSKNLGCKKEFQRKDKLKQHMLTHSVSLSCKRCSRVFKRRSQLNQHEAVCLSEDQPCKDCGHITTSLDNYKKNSAKTKETSHVNRRKHRLLESSKPVDDGVPTIQVVVVPMGALSEQNEQTQGLPLT